MCRRLAEQRAHGGDKDTNIPGWDVLAEERSLTEPTNLEQTHARGVRGQMMPRWPGGCTGCHWGWVASVRQTRPFVLSGLGAELQGPMPAFPGSPCVLRVLEGQAEDEL